MLSYKIMKKMARERRRKLSTNKPTMKVPSFKAGDKVYTFQWNAPYGHYFQLVVDTIVEVIPFQMQYPRGGKHYKYRLEKHGIIYYEEYMFPFTDEGRSEALAKLLPEQEHQFDSVIKGLKLAQDEVAAFTQVRNDLYDIIQNTKRGYVECPCEQ